MSGSIENPLRPLVEQAFEDRSKLEAPEYRAAVEETIAQLDKGAIRVATRGANGEWTVHAWTKQAILLYFGIREMERVEVGAYEYHDKIPLKKNLDEQGVRVVPPGTIRYGAHMEAGSILMPGYVNIGAYVGAGSMVDTWATVGSCAQVGKGVHLSGGVGLGGVLEPPGAKPVIIEDGAFVGSRAIVVEGSRIGAEAVLGANVVITSSTKIIDVTGPEPVEMRGYVPPRSVVIPGTQSKRFPAGEYQVPVALIIGQRKASTDKKVTLNEALRDFGVSV
ncbi:MAG: 2,3,4,5-tetrahydropyridine-2,6-dicarboxylate N-succinyltransferase [Myxococcales bacterium]|nr:2,3,4,5-tetrahydropyridine-2,6-dicarboxylate N-succinyltransferase [Deltaproteobacteria bacterium]NNE18375.1 2,3,4,5-tetrahydropyridine-2,6-dicarboxylate N-succinyltransferase [Myxococcales bacterium]